MDAPGSKDVPPSNAGAHADVQGSKGVPPSDAAKPAAASVQPTQGTGSKSKIWTVGTLTYTMGGLIVVFCWLMLGDFAWQMKERSVSQVFQLLLKYFGASALLLGLLTGSLPAFINMFTGAIIGYKSDRHRGRWGRRIPFLIVPLPFIIASMVGLAFSPALGGWLHDVLGEKSLGPDTMVLITLGVFWTVFELGTFAANSVFDAFVNDVVPRPLLGRYYALFRAVSLIAGIIFSAGLFGFCDPGRKDGPHSILFLGYDLEFYVLVFIGIGIVYGAGFLLMCMMVKEGQYPPPPEDIQIGVKFDHKSVLISRIVNMFLKWLRAFVTYIRDSFSKPYYLGLFIQFMLTFWRSYPSTRTTCFSPKVST